jgi:hypothetical protein
MKPEEFNGYNFSDKKTRAEMKYLVVKRGDLDLNNCYAFRNLRDLKSYLKSCHRKVCHRKVLAVFEIKDKTEEDLKNEN